MEQVTAPAKPVTSILDMLQPFEPDDGQKGSFLVLRIAGIDRSMALRLINRKYRSWQNWRATDNDFQRLDAQIPELIHRFGGEARVLRTALLDAHIIETGILVFRRILRKEPVSDSQWAYAVKMAGLRIPMMSQVGETGNPWERLANSIKRTIAQTDVQITKELDGREIIRARETVVQGISGDTPIQPSPEQRKIASDIVNRILQQVQERESL